MSDDLDRNLVVEEGGVAPRRWLGRLAAAWVTASLIAACVLTFGATVGVCAARVEAPGPMLADSWLQLQACGPTLEDAGALRLSRLWLDGAWWRVITAGMLHGSWLHLALNVWSLWVVGEWVETTWGHARTAVLFGLSSVVGCVASAAWVEAPMVVGASAGIMGMAGALFVGRTLGRGEVAARLRPISARVLGIWLAALVALGFFVDMIAQAGHLGGLVAGLLLGAAWSGREAAIGLAARVGLGLTLAGLMLLARQPQARPHYDEFLGYALLERAQDEAAVQAFERALERQPDDAALANAVAYGLAKAGRRLEYAEELVRRALEQDPTNPDYLDTLGWIYCRSGRTEEGLELVRQALSQLDEDAEEILGHVRDCETAAVE